ncbi:hypothetical protein KP509_07G053200 [Ceratopteris richardii]|nr:hypothetical protein KP509_07G053200 [Ceratopteris richardii]
MQAKVTRFHEKVHIRTMSVDDGIALVAQLKACAKRKDLCHGSKIHSYIVESRLLEGNIFLGSALINMYAKCGDLSKARCVFDALPTRNVHCWTALIAGYAHHDFNDEALTLFQQMKSEGLFPDAITFACILKACGGLRSIRNGQKVHADIVREGFFAKHSTLNNALVDLYAKCGSLAKAQQLFDEFPDRDSICWNSLMTGYGHHGHNEKVLHLFEQMKSYGLAPSSATYICLLKACGSIRAAEKGIEIHDEISKKGLLAEDNLLCTTLLDMYSKCGLLSKAQEVFDKLPFHDIVSWNTLITGYCQNNMNKEALRSYERMKQEEVSSDAITFASLLKACASIGSLELGEHIHKEIQGKGLLQNDGILATSLVDMYVKCGELRKACEVFDEISVQDVVLWNALIAGYCKNGHDEEALECFERMKCKGLSPNTMTFSSLLKVCGTVGATEKGIEIHVEIARTGVERELGSGLVDMYGKCGALLRAQEVFDRLVEQDVISWCALIAGYIDHGRLVDAVASFEKMLHEGPSPDAITFCCILKACESLGEVERGQEYFDLMTGRYGVLPTVEHLICMVHLLGGAGDFDKALAVIDKEPFSDSFELWYALLVACEKWGNVKLGLFAFNKARHLNKDSAALYVSMSKLYAASGMVEDADVMLAKAKEVFDSLPVRDTVSLNALISGYCDRGLGGEALKYFEQQKKEGIPLNTLTFLSALKACGSIGAADIGKQLHEEIISGGLLGKDSVLDTALVDMYSKCGALQKAKEVFDNLENRNAIAWNALIACYSKRGLDDEVLKSFELMQCEGLFPDAVTIASVLRACGNLKLSIKGQQIHEMIVQQRLLGKDVRLASALVDMFSKCDTISKAQEVFDSFLIRDVFSWNALIVGYYENGHPAKACSCYEQMNWEGVSPNENTFAYVLKACSSLGALQKGEEVHAELYRAGLLGISSGLGSSLIDMYAKCGCLSRAQEVSDMLQGRDVFSWTALITGYCHYGLCEAALCCFEQMQFEGVSPDAVTLTCIMKACSSVGAIEKGQMYYDSMSVIYGIVPSFEHHNYAVKLLGYAGDFDKMMAVIKKLSFLDEQPVWFSMLSTCQKFGNIKYGNIAFKYTA